MLNYTPSFTQLKKQIGDLETELIKFINHEDIAQGWITWNKLQLFPMNFLIKVQWSNSNMVSYGSQ